jgi:CheY-like chemotaxis protein
LQQLGHEVVGHAMGGDSAIRLFEKARPDVVFLDILMPGMDGFAALRAIRAMDPDCRVVAMSSLIGTGSYVQQALKLGATELLAKPPTLDSVHRVLSGVGRQTSPFGIQFFGQFLVEAGFLSQEALLDALSAISPTRVAELAMRKGMLLEEELQEIQSTYGKNPKHWLRKAATRGMITEEQVESLRRLMMSDWRQLRAVLVDTGELTTERFERALVQFRQAQARWAIQPRELPEELSGRSEVLALLSMTEATFAETFGVHIQLAAVEAITAEFESPGCAAAVDLSGDFEGRYIFSADRPFAEHVGRVLMSDSNRQLSDDELRDAIGELCNLIVGASASALAQYGHELKVAVPRLLPAARRELIPSGLHCPVALPVGHADVVIA